LAPLSLFDANGKRKKISQCFGKSHENMSILLIYTYRMLHWSIPSDAWQQQKNPGNLTVPGHLTLGHNGINDTNLYKFIF
jgi:hypothetical protein